MQPCPTLIAFGSCTDDLCTFNHDVHVCAPCGVVSTSKDWHDKHLAGHKHRKQMAGRGAPPPGAIHCATCDVYCTNQSQYRNHIGGPKHAQKARSLSFLAVLAEASKDKHGIMVSHEEEGIDFGIVELQQAEQKMVVIQTQVPHSNVVLIDVKLASKVGSSPFSLNRAASGPVLIRSSVPVNVRLSFTSSFRGRFQDRLEFVFEDRSINQQFVIIRNIHAIAGERADHASMEPTAPYIPRKWTSRTREVEVIPGVRPPALSSIPWVVSLPDAFVPNTLSETVASGSVKDILERLRRSFLPVSFNHQTYGRHWKNILWVEEIRMEEDLRIYDMEDASLSTYSTYFYLQVLGLAEKRPSVLVGDRILVRRPGMPEGQWFEGGVHVVRQAEVGLRFNASFRGHTPASRYEVHFKLNRYPIRRQHQAMDTAWAEARVLFPEEDYVHSLRRVDPARRPLRLYNRLIASNPPQLQAVASVLHQEPGSVPFIVFGPPGTGKTVTVIEAMLQILLNKSNARILACAPSNSAADIIAERLAAVLDTDSLFRFYAPSRFKKQVPDRLLDYTCFKPGTETFSIPPMARLKRFRVIVATCVSASMPYGVGMPRGHFSHIFVDEAGQATEPEVMISIKTMCDRTTNVVLSGDPRQLGPIIRSTLAQKLGLEISLLERLMTRPVYEETIGYGVTLVKLVQNFRSHKAILNFPNDRFYNGDLQECGDRKTIDAYLSWTKHPRPHRHFPIIFHAMHGKDDREASSPSFFNIDEVLQVRQYVRDLRDDRRIRITDHDIGIVTPYHAQVQKIRKQLSGIADQVKVGSVEEFQGQERRVIIISTVRSSRDFVAYDLRHTLGFVANPRRFNVAVTRAQALLIVVGDPDVLGLDPLWRSFLNYVHLNGGWTGPPISWDPEEDVIEGHPYDQVARDAALADMNDFTRRMEAMTLGGVAGDVEAAEANADRPWREDE